MTDANFRHKNAFYLATIRFQYINQATSVFINVGKHTDTDACVHT